MPLATWIASPHFVVLIAALSLFYVGGMFLNDAYDAEIDARERANRPIPRGDVSRNLVFVAGFAMLGLGIAAGFVLGMAVGMAGVALAAAVLLYDVTHKLTVLSPVYMGFCRAAVYAMAGLAFIAYGDDRMGDVFAASGEAIAIGAFGLFCYVVGLTYAAKQEAYDRIGAVWPLGVLGVPMLIAAAAAVTDLAVAPYALLLFGWTAYALRLLFRRGPGDVPRAVVSLIAGMALFDAVLIAAAGQPLLAILGVVGFLATLALQRVAAGT